jgi:hypothetical protein
LAAQPSKRRPARLKEKIREHVRKRRDRIVNMQSL